MITKTLQWRGAGRGDHRWVVHIALVYGNRWDLIMPS